MTGYHYYTNPGISIHAPHARSDGTASTLDLPPHISIHAPHARSDRTGRYGGIARTAFQSTLLMRGATRAQKVVSEEAKFQSTLLMRGATTR